MNGYDLVEATRQNNIQEVLRLLDVENVNINSIHYLYGSALGAAAYWERKEMVSLLLDRGADVNIIGSSYGSALGAAAYGGYTEIASLLLDQGADVNIIGGDYGSALGAAAYGGYTEIVSLLLARGAYVNIIGGNYGSALGVAICTGNKKMVSLLLDGGADVNITGGNYRHGSALGIAAIMGREEIVSLLLGRGADVNIIGGNYGSALGAAAYGRYKEIVLLLLGRGADVNIIGGDYGSALGAAAYRGYKEIVSLLLARGADVNIVGGDYGSALGAAAYGGYKEIVLLLLDRGADVNILGEKYGSALGAATSQGYSRIVSLLLDRGACVNTVCGKYGTALVTAAYYGHEHTLSLLIARGADVNAASATGRYGTALAAAALQGKTTIVSLLLGFGADTNIVSGDYGTALAAASSSGHRDIISKLLEYPGTDINAIGGRYGTALGAAFYGTSGSYITKLLLDHGADINLVDSMYGSLLGKAAHKGNKELVSLLLARGADVFHVGGGYETAMGEYPTALDAARAGKATEEIVILLSRTMNNPVPKRDTANWPPFPMPLLSSLAAMQLYHEMDPALACTLETIVNNQSGARNGNLTTEQANLSCKAIDEELLRRALVALVGVHHEAAERLKVWIGNDVRYFTNQGYDLGLAYAAARVAWKYFNDPGFNIAIHRGQWLAKAKHIDEVRENSIYTDGTGQGLIISPYRIMPRRIWDLKSNRVVEFRMLHSEVLARECLSGSVVIDLDKAPTPPFWAITHSWTHEMLPVRTSINQYQWLVPLPRGLDLEHGVRRELLNKGAEYVWVDVLCLRQDSMSNEIKHDEWKLDVPTIGNIYRAAVAIARYFNGLGQSFSTKGWDNERHWLCRAWTLQEIRSENTTYNAGIRYKTSAHIILNTKSRVGGKLTTLRQALHPIVKLAAQVDSPGGCSVYELVQQMAKRYATQPADKVAGLFYLLRTTQLPTYHVGISDRDAWARCFHVLPFERKIEILFDFPYAGDGNGHECQWFPTWRQLMEWPDRDPTYEHTVAVYPLNQEHQQLAQAQKPEHLLVSDIWAISDIQLCRARGRNEYVIDIRDENFGFYYPYVRQKAIETSSSGLYTLVITYPEHSYNWVVCESLGKREQRYRTLNGIKTIEIEPLRKLGVLRTDSCSEFFLGRGRRDSTLAKINALFV